MSDNAKLVLLGEDGENPPQGMPRVYRLTKERTTIGRSRSADLTMDSEAYPCTLSRVHAIIERKPEDNDGTEFSWWVRDCGSLNGTFINFYKVQHAQLHEGDTLTLGGGAGLEEGERSDALASDLVFRFEPCASEPTPAAGEGEPQANAENVDEPQAQNEGNIIVIDDDDDVEIVVSGGQNDAQNDAPVAPGSVDDSVAPPTPDRSSSASRVRTRKRDDQADDDEMYGSSKKRARANQNNSSPTGTLQTSLLDEFKCPICCDYFINATTLACSHSFCELCIEEWLHRKHECAVCRTKVSTKPVRSNALDKSVQVIIESGGYDKKEWNRRNRQHQQKKERQNQALQSLRHRLADAQKRNKTLLDISQEWTQEQIGNFDSGVNNYRGEAREEYCKVTNLTHQWIEEASIKELKVAAKNVNLPPGSVPNSNLRKRLHMFVRYC